MSSSDFGARVHEWGTRFAVPARAERCAVRLFGDDGATLETLPMTRDAAGVFTLDARGVRGGARYRYVLDGEEVTDPFARALPDGPEGAARVESLEHEWQHPALGAPEDLILYELHVGTFTPQGSYAAARAKLPHLAALGVTAIELMPIATFAGRRGWGYDGVAHYAPFAPYGTPEDLAAFIDAAHALGLRVLLDVVYNHFGPAGNALRRVAPDAFTSRFPSPWGEAPDFGVDVMRAYVIDNARYWLHDFRFDGLRLDATHTIRDDRTPHILEALTRLAHDAAPPRLVIAEDDRNDARLVRDLGLDAVWADDLHHQIHVTLTDEQDGYFAAFRGGAAEIARAIDLGWSYCGELNPLTGEPRGTSTEGLPSRAFVHCLQNHDQIGNRAMGDRLTDASGVDAFAAASLLLLTLPSSPLLFMGQEWAAGTPFQYFTDHEPELGRAISEGRRKEFAGFRDFADPEGRARIPDPQSEGTWTASRLDWREPEREPHARILALTRALLGLRATDPVLRDRRRSTLRAWSEGELVIVERTSERGIRRVLANLTSRDLPWPRDMARDWHVLQASSPSFPSQPLRFPLRTAALFARQETRAP